MSETPNGTDALLAAGTAEPVGTWSCDPATETWTWSPEIYTFLGFEPGQVVPTSDLLLSHVLPTADGASATDGPPLGDGRPFSLNLRVRDARNRERNLLVVGRGERDDDGGPVRFRGFVVDLTHWRRSASEGDIRDGIEAAAEFRGAIDQAKGALSALFGMTADEAFTTLVQHSQDANVKVRELATRLLREVARREPSAVSGAGPRALLERLSGGADEDRTAWPA